MVELGQLGDHHGDEKPALRCRALPEGRGEPGGTLGGVGGPGGPREGPLSGDSGGVARQRADVAVLPGGGGGCSASRCGREQLAPPGRAQRPQQLALPPAKPATATAPTPTQTATQVTATPRQPRRWVREGGRGTVSRDATPGGAGPPNPRPPDGTARQRGARHLLWEGGRGQRAQGGAHCPAAH